MQHDSVYGMYMGSLGSYFSQKLMSRLEKDHIEVWMSNTKADALSKRNKNRISHPYFHVIFLYVSHEFLTRDPPLYTPYTPVCCIMCRHTNDVNPQEDHKISENLDKLVHLYQILLYPRN